MSVRIVTPVFRVSYANVWQPKAFEEGKEAKYSLSMIFNKDETKPEEIKAIQDAIKQAIAEKWGADQSKWPRNLKMPLRDADKDDRTNPSDSKFDKNYVNSYTMNAGSKTQPGIVDDKVQPILDQSEFYSGCYARASVTFSAYDNIAKGVGCYLGNLMKVRDGEPLGGGRSAEADFADFRKDFGESNPESVLA